MRGSQVSPYSAQARSMNRLHAGKTTAALTPAASRWQPYPSQGPHSNDTASCTRAAAASSASRTLCRVPLLRAYCSCPLEFFFQKLFLIQISVISAARKQFIMRSTFGDATVHQNNDLIRILHGRRPVRNQNGRAAVHHAAQPL